MLNLINQSDPKSVVGLAEILMDSVANQEPDVVIGTYENPYLRRWWLKRDRSVGSIYLHQILRSDDERALHDHPWDCASVILRGRLGEVLQDGRRILEPGSITYRRAEDAHRLEIIDQPVWSLFLTGPKLREWGFLCPQGWRHWREFTDPSTNGSTVGRGCE